VFEQAHGGTLFLDDLGELPLELQPKLLHALESGDVRPVGAVESLRVDVRVVAATNRPLEEALRERRFRPDLYHRLNVVRLEVPPLRGCRPVRGLAAFRP
jgi:transcriptional regulator with GAF, ATPase, and Fis domain